MDLKEFNRSSCPPAGIFEMCTDSPSTSHHTAAFILINIPLVLPVCVYILCLGAQRRRSRSQISHSDFFTYNMVLIQLVCILGGCLLTLNKFLRQKEITAAAARAFLISSAGTLFFQLFTCFDRFTAVVHPVTYLRLKSQTWALVRNIVCVVVWLLSIIESYIFVDFLTQMQYLIFAVLCFTSCVIVVLVCNLWILHVLIRPGPGDSTKGNQSKLRAFYTITAITGTLMVKFLGDFFSLTSFTLNIFNDDTSCALGFSSVWFTLPSTLVLPLLFLHRNRKIPCLK